MEFNKYEKLIIELGYIMDKQGNLFSPKIKKILTGTISRMGYKILSFRLLDKTIKIKAHRIQAYCKFGDKIYEDGIEVRHLNAIKTDNSWDNIEIGTHSDNMFDIQKEVRIKKAKNAASFITKYDDKTVSEIKQFHEATHSYKKTMENFEISSKGTLYFILNNR